MGSRRFASWFSQVCGGFAEVYGWVHGSLLWFCKIYCKFAISSQRFASGFPRVRGKFAEFATDSRWVRGSLRASLRKFAMVRRWLCRFAIRVCSGLQWVHKSSRWFTTVNLRTYSLTPFPRRGFRLLSSRYHRLKKSFAKRSFPRWRALPLGRDLSRVWHDAMGFARSPYLAPVCL